MLLKKLLNLSNLQKFNDFYRMPDYGTIFIGIV